MFYNLFLVIFKDCESRNILVSKAVPVYDVISHLSYFKSWH